MAYGSTSISGSSSVTINYASAGFTSVPKVLVTYSTTSSNWSGFREQEYIRASASAYTDSFGNDFYVEQTYSALAAQTREQWQIRVEGQLCNTGMQLNVTDYDMLRVFILQELGDWKPQEDEQYEQQ